ncbi:hypothetical protein CMV_024901, partial [Castanea mollissima]
VPPFALFLNCLVQQKALHLNYNHDHEAEAVSGTTTNT